LSKISSFSIKFLEFWNLCPGISRGRSTKDQAFKEWKEKEGDTVIANLKLWLKSPLWTNDNFKYVPAVHRLLKAGKLKEPPPAIEKRETYGGRASGVRATGWEIPKDKII